MGRKAYDQLDNGKNWWRDIEGYGGKYRVNRIGEVQRVLKNGLVRDMQPYRKKGKTFRNRLFVKLTKDGKPKEVAMLKIMAETWHTNKGKGLVPYHKNGIVTDNRVDNIGFTTRKELGRITGHRANKRKCVIKISQSGEEVEVYRSARQAAKENYVSYQTVLDRCHNKVKNPYALDGYTYKFERNGG